MQGTVGMQTRLADEANQGGGKAECEPFDFVEVFGQAVLEVLREDCGGDRDHQAS